MLNHSQWVASGIQTKGSLNTTLLLEVFCLISLCLTARAPDTCREKMEKVSPTFPVSQVPRVFSLTSFKAVFYHIAIQPCCPNLVWWPPLHCHRGVGHAVYCQQSWGTGHSWSKQGEGRTLLQLKVYVYGLCSSGSVSQLTVYPAYQDNFPSSLAHLSQLGPL